MKDYEFSRKQQSQIKGKFAPRYPRPKKEEQEFGPGKENILLCRECGAVYFYKSWHHKLEDEPELEKDEQRRIKYVLCPACQMIKDGKYEGEIVLKDVPPKLREEIKTLAKNFGQRAFEEDPMDRIISVKETKVERVTTKRKRGASSRKEFRGMRDIKILTTENQLARRLAKKINETYGGKLRVLTSQSHQEDVVRIEIVFLLRE